MGKTSAANGDRRRLLKDARCGHERVRSGLRLGVTSFALLSWTAPLLDFNSVLSLLIGRLYHR